MSPFDWWVLIIGLVAGGTIVALLSTDLARNDEDVAADEREAEATFIAAHLGSQGRALGHDSVARVLQAHREYLSLPAPDAIVGGEATAAGGPSVTDEGPATAEATTTSDERSAGD